MYNYGGFYGLSFYGKYNSYPQNDIWINFKWKVISIGNSANSYYLIRPLNSNIYSRIIDEYVYTKTERDNDWLYYSNSHIYSVSGGATVNRSEAGCLNLSSYFNTFLNETIINIHVKDDQYNDYYINGTYVGTINRGYNYKSFIIPFGLNSASNDTTRIFSTLYWFSLTDQMATNIPKPPYRLDEKNNEVYGLI